MTGHSERELPGSLAADGTHGSAALVLTVYNEAASIRQLLHSIDAQTSPPHEVVICDAGSSDGTIEILQQWAARQHRASVLVAPGANIAEGRNIAVRGSSSGIIAVTDGGCVLDPEWMELLTAPIHRGEVDVVFGGTDARGRSIVGKTFAAFYNAKIRDASPTNTEYSSRSVAFTRQAWEQVGGYPEHLTLAGEDTAFFAQLERSQRTLVETKACVVWLHGAETLRSVYALHKRNSQGEGEARSWVKRFVMLISTYLIALVAITWPSSRPSLRSAGAVALVLTTSRASHKTAKWSDDPWMYLKLPPVSLVRDAGMSVGFLKGLWLRPRPGLEVTETVRRKDLVGESST